MLTHTGKYPLSDSDFLQAIEMLSGGTHDSVPLIFLVTDGSVEDERHICDVVRSHLTDQKSICPRICTFGIGIWC